MNQQHIGLLLLLSVLWGGSYLFIGIAVKEVDPLHLVFLRVSLAAAVMLVVLKLSSIPLPLGWSGWKPYLVMGLLNNVIPFSAIFTAQQEISLSLAAIMNSTTPIFTFLILAAFGAERLLINKMVGSVIGLTGVVILVDPTHMVLDGVTKGIILCACAAMSYGFSALWAKRHLSSAPPIQSAACQMLSSTFILTLILPLIGPAIPSQLPSPESIAAILALAILSTAWAYVIFFRLITEAGAGNAMLVTLLVPLSASFLGWLVMNDSLSLHQIIGALTIATALIVVDGRLPAKLKTCLISQ